MNRVPTSHSLRRRTSAPAPSVKLGGVLGEALRANHQGRLSQLVSDERSPIIALFSPEQSANNRAGDWYGEHAGKWLSAAARAARRTGDETLAKKVRRAADFLVGVQEANGYLGTYAPEGRFYVKQPPAERSWDGAPHRRTWDVWTHSYLVLGLLEVHRLAPEPRYLEAARKVGDLFWETLTSGDIDITELGNHFGMSATVLLDPMVELHLATGDRKYLELAQLIVGMAEERDELRLLSQATQGRDAAEIGTGKAYQLSWNLVGLAKLHAVTRDPRYLRAVLNVWEDIRRNHLTLGGGPWGGVAHRSREVFNPRAVFDPRGYVETCSSLSWLQLNRELLQLTGEAAFAEEIERVAYNDLLGAQAPNGEDWIYYSFPNGKRVFTTEWRCCKSSGAMALEELPAAAYGCSDAGVQVNLYGPSRATLATPAGSELMLEQDTRYPFDGAVRLRVTPGSDECFPLRLRIPGWASGATVEVNGEQTEVAPVPGAYLELTRTWRAGDEISLCFPMPPVLHRKVTRNVQESLAPDGSPVAQEVMRREYAAVTRGPLVYATDGLVDGFKHEETILLRPPEDRPLLEVSDPPAGALGPAIQFNLDHRAPLHLQPYFEAGGREDGTWRLTWLNVAPEEA